MGQPPRLWIEANFLTLIEAVIRILNERDHNIEAHNPLNNPLSKETWTKIASDQEYGFFDKRQKFVGGSAVRYQFWRLVKAYQHYPSDLGRKFPVISEVIYARLDEYFKLVGSLYDLAGGQMLEISTDLPRNMSDGDAILGNVDLAPRQVSQIATDSGIENVDLAAGQISHTLTNILGTPSDEDTRLEVQNPDNSKLVTGDGSKCRVRFRTEPHAISRRLRPKVEVELPEVSMSLSKNVSFYSKTRVEKEEMQISEGAFAGGSRCTPREEEEMQVSEGVSAGGTRCTSRAEEDEMQVFEGVSAQGTGCSSRIEEEEEVMHNIPRDGHPKQAWEYHKFPMDVEALKKLLQIREEEATDLKEWCRPRFDELSDQKRVVDILREAVFNKRSMVLSESTSFDPAIKALSFKLMCARVRAAYENCRNLVDQIFTSTNQEVLDAVEVLCTQCLVHK